MEENKYIEEQYDEIDLMELLRKLLSHWKMVLVWGLAAAVVGVGIGFSIPREYSAGAKLAPETVSKNNGSLSSLASMAGINLSTMSTSDAVYPELYPEIVASNPFIVDLFSIPVTFEHKDGIMRTDLYEYVKEYTRSPWWSAVVSAPMKALGWLMNLLRGGEKEKVEGYSDVDPAALTLEQERIAKAIRESISIVVDKKTGVITASVVAQDPSVAATLASELIDRLQNYVSAYRTEKSRKDLQYYEQLYDEAKVAYYDAQQRYARYVDANHGVVLQSVRTEEDRLRNEMELNFSLYNTCAQQLQMAKAKVQMETPVYAVINPPTMPLESFKPSKMKMMVVFAFLGVMCVSVWILWGKDWIARLKNDSKDDPDTESAETETAKTSSSQ